MHLSYAVTRIFSAFSSLSRSAATSTTGTTTASMAFGDNLVKCAIHCIGMRGNTVGEEEMRIDVGV